MPVQVCTGLPSPACEVMDTGHKHGSGSGWKWPASAFACRPPGCPPSGCPIRPAIPSDRGRLRLPRDEPVSLVHLEELSAARGQSNGRLAASMFEEFSPVRGRHAGFAGRIGQPLGGHPGGLHAKALAGHFHPEPLRVVPCIHHLACRAGQPCAQPGQALWYHRPWLRILLLIGC